VALMGDPSLRLHSAKPVQSLSATTTATLASLRWASPNDSGLRGYRVYRSTSRSGPFARVAVLPASTTTFSETLPAGTYTYLVRAEKLENTASGTYVNLSQGVFETVTLSAPVVGSEARFIGSDSSTLGNWNLNYGKDGAVVAKDQNRLPSYAQMTLSGKSDWTWVYSTADERALKRSGSNDRIASCWYSNSEFSMDLNLTDNQFHRVSFYMLDWDRGARSQTVEVRDATTDQLLSTQEITAFEGGRYLSWDLRGHVRIRLLKKVGFNAVVSGVFFGGAPIDNPPPGNAAQFLGSDLTTRGTWKGVYGNAGSVVIGESSRLPAYVSQLSPVGKSDWTWQWSTTDLRAVQRANSADRLAACWYSTNEFRVDLAFNDQNYHKVSFYFLDWDQAARAISVQILDASTGAVLDTRTLANFGGGVYQSWNLKGSVRVRVLKTSGANAVISGIFFD
jgi:hypothetical protein